MQNDQFIKQIKTASQKKLDEIKQTLDQQLEEQLKDLKTQVAQAKEQLETKKEFIQQVQKARQSFDQYLDLKFKQQQYYQQEISKIWGKTAQRYFSDKQNFTNWLTEQLKSLKDQQGTIRVGESASQVKKILGSQSKIKIQTDNQVGKGFIFENDQVLIDHTLENYLRNKFDQVKDELAKVLND